MRGQLLDGVHPARSVAQAAAAVCGLQAQSWPAAILQVRPRSTGLTAHDVEAARSGKRSVVRTWAMRGTLHLLPSEDVGWMLRLLGPMAIASAASRNLQLGLDADTLAAGTRAIDEALSSRGPLTREEIAEVLLQRGTGVDVTTQALIHMLQHTALLGVTAYGPDRGKAETFVRLHDWLRPAALTASARLNGEAAVDELARRYVTAFGPATYADFGAWSGLGARLARGAWGRIAADMVEVSLDGTPAWLSNARAAEGRDLAAAARPSLRLLAAYDTYVLGYTDRGLMVPASLPPNIWPGGGGVIRPAIVEDGMAIGTWAVTHAAGGLIVRAEPFDARRPIDPERLRSEAADIGRFLAREVRVSADSDDPPA